MSWWKAEVRTLTCSSLLLAIMCFPCGLVLMFAWLSSCQIIVETEGKVIQWLKQTVSRWTCWVLVKKNKTKKNNPLNNPREDVVCCTELHRKQVKKKNVTIVAPWRRDRGAEEQVSRRCPPGCRMATLGLWSASRSVVCPIMRYRLSSHPPRGKQCEDHRHAAFCSPNRTEATFPAPGHSYSALRKAESWLQCYGGGS